MATGTTALLRVDKIEQIIYLRSLCDQAIAFQPQSGKPWGNRGNLRYPAPEAIADLRKAIELHDDSYAPYYYLAHDALTKHQWQEACEFADQSLRARRPPPKRIQAQLYSWLAICKDCTGAGREEVRRLFKRAQEIDPANELVNESYRVFLDSVTGSDRPAVPTWPVPDIERIEYDLSMFDRQARLAEAFQRSDPVQRELQAVA